MNATQKAMSRGRRILFFRWADWRTHTRPRAEGKRGDVNEASRIAECRRLLTEPWTDEDRAKAEAATRAYLASVEAGC